MPNIAQIGRILIVFVIIKLTSICDTTHITGNFRTDDFFKFIVKFGFQKTERHSQRDSFGYIYGNITSQDAFQVPVTFAVLDKASLMEFYGNRTLTNRDLACQRMFSRVEQLAYDSVCNPHAKTDYLRRVPCPRGRLCEDEDSPGNVVPGNQFTYVISDLYQPRFWYISVVACYRNTTTCKWHYYDYTKHNANKLVSSRTNRHVPQIYYDFHLVNGNPNRSSSYPLTFHFSFDQQYILEMFLGFLLIYIILVPMQIYAVRIQKHPVTRLFTLSLIAEFVSLSFITGHLINFAITGIGYPRLQTTGDILDILSRTSFMLILLLLAKGWAVTRQQISKTDWVILMTIWIPYCGFQMFLYIWNRTEVDVISDIDEYQTWPGWIVLVCRTIMMMWFLWELRNTMKYEHSTKKLDFLLHFGASSLVWFIYLPIVAIVALQVSPMWRYKLLLGITNSADCLAYCVMTGLLWPNRAGQYLLLAGPSYTGMDELDEFSEAPHVVNGDTFISDRMPPTILDDRLNGRSRERDALSLNGSVFDSSGNLLNGDLTTDLLDGDDLDANLLTDLNKNSHIIA